MTRPYTDRRRGPALPKAALLGALFALGAPGCVSHPDGQATLWGVPVPDFRHTIPVMNTFGPGHTLTLEIDGRTIAQNIPAGETYRFKVPPVHDTNNLILVAKVNGSGNSLLAVHKAVYDREMSARFGWEPWDVRNDRYDNGYARKPTTRRRGLFYRR